MTEFAHMIEPGVHLYADGYGTGEIATPSGVYVGLGPDISDPTIAADDICVHAIGRRGRVAIHISKQNCERYDHWLALAVALGHSP